MYTNLFLRRCVLSFTASRGHSLALLTDGGRDWGRRAMNSKVNALVPLGSYDDDPPELPLSSERPLRTPIDVPVPKPIDVPVRGPHDIPIRDPHDVPHPPAEPPFPRAPQPVVPPERKPEADVWEWLNRCCKKTERADSMNPRRRKSDR